MILSLYLVDANIQIIDAIKSTNNNVFFIITPLKYMY